jgi:3-hydroxyisobutyrate dehydrogenase
MLSSAADFIVRAGVVDSLSGKCPPTAVISAVHNTKIGFIGLGNVGGKLAGSLARHKIDLTVRDLNPRLQQAFVARGAAIAASPREMAQKVDILITCLPSPAASAEVMERADGILAGLGPGKVWLEMSTTDSKEVRRLGALVEQRGSSALDCPVSGGCHRAETGNISIFAGGPRAAFEQVLPILSILGRRIVHTGPLGSASVLKVLTNYLCTVHLAALAEALTVAKVAGMDMNTAYEAIRISSGNSFVHETESQVILNGSRDISFTMDLVIKDVGLFDSLARELRVPLELSPLVLGIFRDGERRYGPRELSPNIIRRLEEACAVKVLGDGFPPQMVDDEPEAPGYEVQPRGRGTRSPMT